MKILCIDNKDYHPILEGIIPKITEDFLIFGNYKAAEKKSQTFNRYNYLREINRPLFRSGLGKGN